MKIAHLFNHPDKVSIRKKLRNNMPKAEILLWSELQCKRLEGLRFRRQYGVGRYILDFYCPKIKFAIEVDGDSHFTDKAEKYDKRRQEYIESKGIKVFRCTNTDVFDNMDGVIEDILYEIGQINKS